MSYHITKALEIMPYVSIGLLALVLVIFEVKAFREPHGDSPVGDPARGGFLPPPGDGYEYFVSAGVIVYILRKASNRFRVYLVQDARGDANGVSFKRDRYGQYISLRCENAATAEKIADNLLGN